MNTIAINGAEVFELLRDDLAAIEREFGRDTVSDVTAITEIGEYLRGAAASGFAPLCCYSPPSFLTMKVAAR